MTYCRLYTRASGVLTRKHCSRGSEKGNHVERITSIVVYEQRVPHSPASHLSERKPSLENPRYCVFFTAHRDGAPPQINQSSTRDNATKNQFLRGGKVISREERSRVVESSFLAASSKTERPLLQRYSPRARARLVYSVFSFRFRIPSRGDIISGLRKR